MVSIHSGSLFSALRRIDSNHSKRAALAFDSTVSSTLSNPLHFTFFFFLPDVISSHHLQLLCISLLNHPGPVSLLFNSLLVDHEQQLTATFDAMAHRGAAGRGSCIIATFSFFIVICYLLSPRGMSRICRRLVFPEVLKRGSASISGEKN